LFLGWLIFHLSLERKGALSMRFARDIANFIVRGGLKALDEAPPEMAQRAVQSITRLLAPFEFALLQRSDCRALIDAIRIVGEAVLVTPYGQPLQFPAPLLITLGTSRYCPHSCANCYSHSNRSALEVVDRGVVDRISRSRTPVVMISGGEPLALPGIEGMLRHLIDAGKFVYLATNSSISPITGVLRDHPHSLFLLLSLWGPKAQHDRQRGAGSYGRLVRNIKALNDLSVQARLQVILTSDELDVFDTVEELVSSHRISGVLVTRKIESGRSDGIRCVLTPAAMKRIVDRAKSIKRFVRQVYLDVPEVRTKRAPRAFSARGLLGLPAHNSCSAGNWMMHLDASGTAHPCYTLEYAANRGAPAGIPIAEQWERVRQRKNRSQELRACLAEGLSEGSL
jgi:MoaA/NifB/PqqE/SkfB family radical SAM enzyme